uniref:Uncharacterized protein n=1 Tax=Acrobeloides nanus TaxID=290746 RepID=A0A914CT71_9BILA
MQLLNDSWHTPGYCGPTFDAILCWPEAPPNTTVRRNCPVSVEHVVYVKGEATRYCQPNGIWDSVGNYSSCRPFGLEDDPITPFHAEIMYWIYVIGYSLSLVVCIFALLIFVHYKSLWCLRNIIHTNIIAAFTIHNITWLLFALFSLHLPVASVSEIVSCSLPIFVLKFCVCAAFFWMLVEGFYLFVNVLFSFHAQKIRFWMCSAVGWGGPAILSFATVLRDYHSVIFAGCWNWRQTHLDVIIIIPILIVIIVNIFFLLVIIYVLLAKLKLTTTHEFARYSRGIRALIVLCPLLGINYAVVLFHPNNPYWLSLMVSYFSVIISSFQGLLVAVFFCFKNKEVQECLQRSIDLVKTSFKIRAEMARRRKRPFKVEKVLSKDLLPSFGFFRIPRSFSTNTEEFKYPSAKTSSAAEALISKGSARYSVPVVMLGEDGRLFRVELKSSAKPQNSTAF